MPKTNMDLLDLISKAKNLVVYPCSGLDWMAITFTEKNFLEHVTKGEVVFANSDTYVFIDKQADRFYEELQGKDIAYEDKYTLIKINSCQEIKAGTLPSYLLNITWKSLKKPKWSESDLPDRSIKIILVCAHWKQFAMLLQTHRIAPYIGIGVTDGDAFGGNDECVNSLSAPRGMSAKDVTVSRYWISDHFCCAAIPDQLKTGEYITSRDEHFPFKFRKLALLSSDWGNYGHNTTLGGATLFEIEMV